MDKRNKVAGAFRFLWVCFNLLPALSDGSEVQPRPNFLIIVTDDQRQDTFRPQFMPRTWKWIAGEGINFLNGFVTTPLCCPSRASILTGTLARDHGVLRNITNSNKVPFADMNHFPEDLRDHGYYTGLVGKFLNSWRHGWKGRRKREFEYWASLRLVSGKKNGYYNFDIQMNTETVSFRCSEPPAENCHYSTDELVRHALMFLQEAVRSNRPFLLYFAPLAPHGPSTPAWRHLDLYTEISPYRTPSFGEPDITDKPYWLQDAPWIHRDDAGNRVFSPGEVAGLDRSRLSQLQSLAAVDEGIDTMIRFLGRANRLRNTVVLYLSDNGHYWGEHYLRGKNAAYEESIHVPFAARYPPLIPPNRPIIDSNHLVANIDIAPTIYELAGLKVPSQVRGKSLVPLLKGKKTKWRKNLFFEGWPDRPGDIGDPNQCRPPFRAIRDNRYVYIEYQTNKGTGVPCIFAASDRAELYDMVADPYQIENLSGDPSVSRIEKNMKKELDEYPKLDAPVQRKD